MKGNILPLLPHSHYMAERKPLEEFLAKDLNFRNKKNLAISLEK